MTESKQTKKYTGLPAWWLAGLPIIGIVGVLLGSFLDLPIDIDLYNPQSQWGWVMAAYGPLPCFWSLSAAGYWLLAQTKHQTGWKKTGEWILGVGLLIFCVIYITNSGLNALSLEFIWALLLSLALVLLPGALLYQLVCDSSPGLQKRLFWLIVIVCAGQFIIVQTLKVIWLRPRFLAIMIDPRVPFVPWYAPDRSLVNEFSALYQSNADLFKSFPSGHTASAACMLIWSVLPLYEKELSQKWKRYITYAICFAVPVIVAISRMVLGYHFLSDVSAGFLISASLFSIGYYFLYIRKPLTKEDLKTRPEPTHVASRPSHVTASEFLTATRKLLIKSKNVKKYEPPKQRSTKKTGSQKKVSDTQSLQRTGQNSVTRAKLEETGSWTKDLTQETKKKKPPLKRSEKTRAQAKEQTETIPDHENLSFKDTSTGTSTSSSTSSASGTVSDHAEKPEDTIQSTDSSANIGSRTDKTPKPDIAHTSESDLDEMWNNLFDDKD